MDNIGTSDYWELQFVEVRAPEDPVKMDDELWCAACEMLVCDVEHGDSLDTLARTAKAHVDECKADAG